MVAKIELNAGDNMKRNLISFAIAFGLFAAPLPAKAGAFDQLSEPEVMVAYIAAMGLAYRECGGMLPGELQLRYETIATVSHLNMLCVNLWLQWRQIGSGGEPLSGVPKSKSLFRRSLRKCKSLIKGRRNECLPTYQRR
jgi:hypothetical protein